MVFNDEENAAERKAVQRQEQEISLRAKGDHRLLLANRVLSIMASGKMPLHEVPDAKVAEKLRQFHEKAQTGPLTDNEIREIALLYTISFQDRNYNELLGKVETLNLIIEFGHRAWRADKRRIWSKYKAGDTLEAIFLAPGTVSKHREFCKDIRRILGGIL